MEKKSVRCMDRVHEICSTKGKATGRIYMVQGETHNETNNFSSWWCVARYVEIHVWCSKEESKTKMSYRETKARQCQIIERNILHWTKRWRIQARNGSSSEKVGSSDASSNALRNIDKEQWRIQRNIGKRKTKYACVVDADESTRPRLEGAGHKPHQYHIPARRTNSMTHRCLVHKFIQMPKALKTFQMQKAAVEKNWRKIPAWQLESQKQERSDRWSKEERKKSSFRVIDGSLSS